MVQSNEKYTIGYANAVIAKFMGYEYVVVGYAGSEEETEWQRNNEEWMNKVGIENVGRYLVNIKEDEWYPFDDINYHISWGQLMPVVEKIESIGNAVRIYTGHTTISTKDGIPICQIVDKTKISATHKAVYQFITWYNQQKQANGQNNAG